MPRRTSTGCLPACIFGTNYVHRGDQIQQGRSFYLKVGGHGPTLSAEISELEAHKQGSDVILAFEEDVGLALSQASDYPEGIILAKAANILRRHMLDHTSKFDGTFHDGCIEEAFPTSLLQFVGTIGADIKSQLIYGVSKTDLVIAQLLQYNSYAKCKEGAATHRHSTHRETPFPVFMGMSVYAKTRKRTLLEMLHEHGISIII